jgi:proline dehydrogenase
LAFEIGVVLLEVMSVTAREPMCLVIGLERLGSPVCIENLIRFDCVAESHNVSANGRADILLAERGCLALQVEEPA